MNASDAVLITSVFVLAGTVKGVIGLGLPTVSLGLLTASLGLEAAMALMLAPSFVTNIWQALNGGNGLIVLKRIWPFLLLASIAVWPGVVLGAQWESEILTSILGGLLIVYGVSGLARSQVRTPPSRERWAGPLTGCINGFLTGLTGSFVVPGVLYLQSLSLSRDELVQAMGMLFTCSTIALAVGLSAQGKLPAQISVSSILAVVPALLGMIVGRSIRTRLSEAAFKRVFFAALIALGAYVLGWAFT